MTDIQRYDYDTIANSPLKYRADVFVLASDAEAAIAAAEQRAIDGFLASTTYKVVVQQAETAGYEQGQRDEHERMEAEYQRQIQQSFQRGIDVGQRDALAAAVSRVEALREQHENAHGVLIIPTRDVIAAIKGDNDGSV